MCAICADTTHVYIIYCVIQEPEIDSQSTEGLKPEKFDSDIVFDDIHFSYPARPDVQVRITRISYIVLLASITAVF